MMLSFYLWTILSLTLVQAAPIEDIGELSLDLQPPFENLRDFRQLTDSYGQPIDSSYIKAESTPEGRKVAKTGDGIQFEIPAYASGIIDDRKIKEDSSSGTINPSVINNPQSQIPLNVIIPKIEPHIHSNSNIEFEIVKSMEIELKDIEPKIDHKRQSDEAQGSGIRAPVAIFDEQKQLFTQFRRPDYARKLNFDPPHTELLPPHNKDNIQNVDEYDSSQLLNENMSSTTLSPSVLPIDKKNQAETTILPILKKKNEPHIELELLPPFLDDHPTHESSHLNLTKSEEDSVDENNSVSTPLMELLPTAESIIIDKKTEIEAPSLDILPSVLPDNLQKNTAKIQEASKTTKVIIEPPVTDILPPFEDTTTAINIETTPVTEIDISTEEPQIETIQPSEINAKIDFTEIGNVKSDETHPDPQREIKILGDKNFEADNVALRVPSTDLLPPYLEVDINKSIQPAEADKDSKTQIFRNHTDNKIETNKTSTISIKNKNSLTAKIDVPELVLDLLPPLQHDVPVDLEKKLLPLNNEAINITNKTIKEINQLALDLLSPINDNKSASTNPIINNKSTEKTLIPEVLVPSETTENSPWNGDIYKGGFGGSSGFLGEQKQIGTYHTNQNSNPDLGITEPIPITEVSTFVKPTSKASVPPVLVSKTKTDHYEGDIYKGGFGGPGGFLGEQKNIGTAHNANAAQPSTASAATESTTIIIQTTPTQIRDIQNSNNPFISDIGPNTGILGEQKQIGLHSNKIQVKLEKESIIGTTPPPISLFSISTTSASANKIINKTSTAFPAFNFSPTFTGTSSTIVRPSPLFEPPFLEPSNQNSKFKINVPNNNFSEQPSTSFAERLNFDKQKPTGANDFRFPSGNPPTQTLNIQPNVNIPLDQTPLLPPRNSQKPSPIAPWNTLPQNVGQKPTLAVQPTNNINFGGAPGILGNQKPGYAVQPDGTIKDPDHQYKGPTAAPVLNNPVVVQKPIAPAAKPENNANKYNGGFGGAPGILTPFDNGV